MLITDHFNLNVQGFLSINFNFFATPHNPDDAQPGGWGGGGVGGGGIIYCFWCRSIRCPHSFFSIHYLLNQLMDLTKLAYIHCLDVGKRLLDFGDLDLIYKVIAAL